MKIGYARTSTVEQEAGLGAQERDLHNAGCEKIYKEQVSSVDATRREQLVAALDFVREGDTLVVTRLDRLARSTRHLMEIVEALEKKGTALRILNLGIDTGTPTGKLVLTVMGGIAEFEREVMLERQREGIAKAKAEGKYKGRAPTARARASEVRALAAEGVKKREIARRLEISERSVYRVLAQG